MEPLLDLRDDPGENNKDKQKKIVYEAQVSSALDQALRQVLGLPVRLQCNSQLREFHY